MKKEILEYVLVAIAIVIIAVAFEVDFDVRQYKDFCHAVGTSLSESELHKVVFKFILRRLLVYVLMPMGIVACTVGICKEIENEKR